MSRKIGKLATPATRTGAPKKIAEWSSMLPGGSRIIFDVGAVFNEGESWFEATSKHPNFTRFKLIDADINVLREKVQGALDEVISTDMADGWVPAHVLETRIDRRVFRERTELTINLSARAVETQRDGVVGNRGETKIRSDWEAKTVIQRGLDDDFSGMQPKSGSLLDPEVNAWLASPFRDEPDTRVARIVVPEQDDRIHEIFDTVERFSRLLAERLSWSQTAGRGLMEPAELTEMMARAVAEVGQA